MSLEPIAVRQALEELRYSVAALERLFAPGSSELQLFRLAMDGVRRRVEWLQKESERSGPREWYSCEGRDGVVPLSGCPVVVRVAESIDPKIGWYHDGSRKWSVAGMEKATVTKWTAIPEAS